MQKTKAEEQALLELEAERREIIQHLVIWPKYTLARARLAQLEWRGWDGTDSFRKDKIEKRRAEMAAHIAVAKQCEGFRKEMEARMEIEFTGSGKRIE